MRRLLLFIFCLFTLSGFVHAQRMSDEQVVEYVKNAQAAGKSQKQMTTELLRRGVTQEQVLRIKSRYEATNSTAEGTGNKPNQMRKHAVALDSSYEAAELEDQKAVIDEKQDSKAHLEMSARQIFGHNLFRNTNLSFEPSANLATPISYRLGPGDEVIIDIWGASENTIRQTISPEGDIQVKDLGPVHLNGMTVKEANQYLQREFSKIYEYINQLGERHKYHCFLVMVTMETAPDSMMYIENIEQALEYMEEAIRHKIRKIDVCTRYSAMQYLIILFEPDESQIPKVMDRIFIQYYKLYDKRNFIPKYEYLPINEHSEETNPQNTSDHLNQDIHPV